MYSPGRNKRERKMSTSPSLEEARLIIVRLSLINETSRVYPASDFINLEEIDKKKCISQLKTKNVEEHPNMMKIIHIENLRNDQEESFCGGEKNQSRAVLVAK